MPAKVYYTNLRADSKAGLLDKMERLFKAAGLNKVIDKGDLVAIKLHFGELGNLAYIRPPYLRRLVQIIKKLGGKPFLTDANTLYVGSRSNAVDHLETAIANGFDYAVVGAPLIIADGLTGKDYVKVPINGEHFNEVNIGSAAYHADAMIVMTHFKGHELTGFGGAIKNVGMGLGSRSGKQQMHSDVLPRVRQENCTGCSKCMRWCPAEAIVMIEWEGNKAGRLSSIVEEKCWGCGECIVTCNFGAMKPNWRTTPQAAQEKVAEYALGAVKGKEGKVGYINFVMNISPDCDCTHFNDLPIVADIGILASTDPVALDKACVDLVNSRPAQMGSVIEGLAAGQDKFKAVHPNIDWKYQLIHAQKIGLGTMEYELKEV
ncbi:MAG TPA: DUF362 domain-containing protein [Syntrophomonadaceae bacterium]|jgi:uncharacterized Fe-S center protein|nr:DUF362 domain-containing protein [Syntrophomonadaceae bacterium]HOQ10664.1 DUF362 domain-containing protein [Syntrophomonadaceae bacterium]HPU49907.1 DUF362 domain-containing protein [Syntrophomonadaceae bacterium]